MRIAIVSDIHGNRAAFEAVLADLRQTSPDMVLHGGDLADSGASPVDVIDQVRDLAWQGVVGNTDEMLTRPASLDEYASEMPALKSLFSVVGEMAGATRERLGEERLAWLRSLPPMQTFGSVALVHASPASAWRAPAPEDGEAVLESVYGTLHKPVVVYAHIHRPFISSARDMTVVNTGSVGLPYDGDPRASYLLLDDCLSDKCVPSIRRVEYDVAQELKSLAACGLPHTDWIAKTLECASPVMPE
jgi:putative phosphoesterase